MLKNTTRATDALKRKLLVLAVVCGLLATAACANLGAAGDHAACPVRILVVANFTGPGSVNGDTVDLGTKSAAEEINKNGGVRGCDVVIDKVDDGSDYHKSLPLMQEATAKQNYALVLDWDYSVSSTVSYMARQKLFSVIGQAQLDPNAKYTTLFDTLNSEPLVMVTALQYAAEQRHKRVAVMVDNSSIGADSIKAIKAYAKEEGITITDSEQLDLTGVNFVPAIERARRSNPDVLLTDLWGLPSAQLRLQIHQAGWDIPIISGSFDADTTFKGLIPESMLANNVMIAPSSIAYPSRPALESYAKKLKTSGVKLDNYFTGYTSVYDAVILFAWAANEVKSLNPETLAGKLNDSRNAKIPGLLSEEDTGYEGKSDALAVVQGGYYADGRLKKIVSIQTPVDMKWIVEATK